MGFMLTLLVSYALFAGQITLGTRVELVGEQNSGSVHSQKSPEYVRDGERLRYTIIALNDDHNPQGDIAITNPLPADTVYVEGSAGCRKCRIEFSSDGEHFTADRSQVDHVVSLRWMLFAELAPGQTEEVYFEVTYLDPTSIAQPAEIARSPADLQYLLDEIVVDPKFFDDELIYLECTDGGAHSILALTTSDYSIEVAKIDDVDERRVSIAFGEYADGDLYKQKFHSTRWEEQYVNIDSHSMLAALSVVGEMLEGLRTPESVKYADISEHYRVDRTTLDISHRRPKEVMWEDDKKCSKVSNEYGEKVRKLRERQLAEQARLRQEQEQRELEKRQI